jgi:hypothetical protein
MSWFRKELWEGMVFDWPMYWREILKADNAEFFNHARANLSLFHLSVDVLSQETLELYDAAKILHSLEMDFNHECHTVHQLVGLRRINTLRLLHGMGIDMFSDLESPLQTLCPDVLDFVLSINNNNDIVDVPWIAKEAIKQDLLRVLKILYHWQKKCPLNQARLTLAAEFGRLGIIQWAYSIEPTVRVGKVCIPKIMNRGHVKVFEFLYSLDKSFLPAAYCENHSCRLTMWHYTMIVRLYEIDSKLVPLVLLYRHAVELKNYKVALWTGSKIYETTDKVIVTEDDIDGAIDYKAWLFVLWGVKYDPRLIPRRGKLSLKTNGSNFPNMPKTQRELIVLLDYLYTLTSRREYLPTVDELRNQPIEYVHNAYFVDPPYLDEKDLVTICSFKATGTEIHEWLSGLGINVATVEMANMAAWIGNIEALYWINEQSPEAFPSQEYIERGLKFPEGRRRAKLVKWVFDIRPEKVPFWWFLDLWGYQFLAPQTLREVKDYQERQSHFSFLISSVCEAVL